MKPKLMLAKRITMEELKEWDVRMWEDHYIEPKVDGVRFVRTEPGVWLSRQGKIKHNVDHITSRLDRMKRYSDYLIDGELFSSDWSTTISATHSHFKTGLHLSYRIFDIVPLQNPQMPLMERKEVLEEMLEGLKRDAPIFAVSSTIVSSFSDFRQVFNNHCASGCDGAMIKRRKGPYEFKRSKYWLKVKPYMEMDCKIVGFTEGKGKYEGTLGAIVVKVPVPKKEGSWSEYTTKVSGMTDDDRDYIWKNATKLRGKIAEVRYRAISEKIRLIEPRLIRIRVDKDVD